MRKVPPSLAAMGAPLGYPALPFVSSVSGISEGLDPAAPDACSAVFRFSAERFDRSTKCAERSRGEGTRRALLGGEGRRVPPLVTKGYTVRMIRETSGGAPMRAGGPAVPKPRLT